MTANIKRMPVNLDVRRSKRLLEKATQAKDDLVEPAPLPKVSLQSEKEGIGDDWPALLLLLLLYTIQGIPMGLSASVPFLLQGRDDLSYADQALFSFCTWPFSLKLIWAPIVDSLYFERFGRRKTWVIPVQFLAAGSMLYAATAVEQLLGETGEPADIKSLTLLFFCIYFLMATQDIAVDGWAITMLSDRNVELSSTANTVGQQFGYFVAFIGFLGLNEPSICDTYFRRPLGFAETDEPLVTLSGFLYFFGTLTLATTILVAFLVSEKPTREAEIEGISNVYSTIGATLKESRIHTLILVLLTYRAPFAVADNITSLKMIEYGFDKSRIAMVTPLLLPVYFAVPFMAKAIGAHPLSVWLMAFPVRLCIGLLDLFIVAKIPEHGDAAFWSFVASSLIWTVVCSLMFTSQMEYFARLASFVHFSSISRFYVPHLISWRFNSIMFPCPRSHKAVGGTFMTLLNTIANLGGSWPQPVALTLVDLLSVKGVCGTKDCPLEVDGFFQLGLYSFVLGVVWYIIIGTRLGKLRHEKSD